MQVNPYLNFDGDCADAFRFYEKALGGEIQALMTWGESPMAETCTPIARDRVMHACMKLGNAQIMGGDCPPDRFQKMQGVTVNLGVAEPDEADRVFAALAEGGVVHMPIGETFWARRFGMVTDRFGTPWMVNCSKPM